MLVQYSGCLSSPILQLERFTMNQKATFSPSRRDVLGAGAAALGGVAITCRSFSTADAAQASGSPDAGRSEKSGPWLRKTLKAGMIRVEGPWEKKFQTAVDAGYEGVEPSTGKLNIDEMRKAAEKTGIIIDGTVAGHHWTIRHTDPDPKVREQAQALLHESLEQTAALGAESLLLVPGHGKDGTEAEVKKRAFDAISKAIPLADRLGVHILIENVWNSFLYDHEGDQNQSAQPLADFIDSFGTDTVGVHYDIGNHWKFGDAAQWATTLGKRIQKLDIKGFSRAEDKFTDITEGDIDWVSVRNALVGIGFQGWLAAEVGGGDEQRLKKVAAQMEAALDCSKTFAEVSAMAKQPA